MSQKNYPGCEICTILPDLPEDMQLMENEHWNVNLSDQNQGLLGRSYITLKRHASELDELTPAEDEAFTVVRNGLFKAIRASFQPITFNTTCLKNDAFRADPDNTPSEAAHVHWHVLPRYGTNPTSFAGETFTDPQPGRYLRATPKQSVSRDTALAIAATIRANL